jgi:hypothetical protein
MLYFIMKWTRSESNLNPYTQGELDGLCGLYAVINAVRISATIKYKHCQHIFHQSLKLLASQQDSSEVVFDGMSRACLSKALAVAATKAPIAWSWPFYRKKASLAVLWGTIENFINERQGNAAILWIGGHDWAHWTVVKEVTPRKMVLFDSWHRRCLTRGKCTIGEPTRARPIYIGATCTCFITRKPA